MGDQREPRLDTRVEAGFGEVVRPEVDFPPTRLSADGRPGRAQMIRRFAIAAVIAAALGTVGFGLALHPGITTPQEPIASLPSDPGPAAAATPSRPSASSPAPSPSATSALAGLPAAAALVAAAGQGALVLESIDQVDVAPDEVVRFTAAPHRGALAVAVGCIGADSIGVAFSDAPLPSADPDGADSPFSGQAPCDGAPHVVPWNGWNSVILAHGPHIGLGVKRGTVYRAVLVDTSAVAAEGEQNAVAAGLPTINHMSAARSDVGQIIATNVQLRPGGDTGSGGQVADIRPSSAIRVVVACRGGTVDVSAQAPDNTAGNATYTSGSSIGSPACDGTLQAFDWTRADGPADTASVVVNATPGTAWRIVVWDMTSGSHPKPTAPCGSTAGLKAAPMPTLYQNGRALGSLPFYFTSSWASVHDDGAPVVPRTSLVAKAGVPLQLRTPHDICAGAWSVVYGTAAAGGLGIDPVGALALLNEYPTTIASRENRIDLASLPPGDWVLEISLFFDKGGGVGLLGVHSIP